MSEVPHSPPTCPPLSRREARREERRETILEVARGYFLEHGYAGTTMSGIAAALGGSKGTLWNYYSAKDRLFGDVLEKVTLAFREKVSVALQPNEPVETALHRFCVEFLTRLGEPTAIALYRLVVGESARFPEVGRMFYERATGGIQQLLTAYLAAAMARGELRQDDPLEAAQFLTGLCTARSHMKLLSGVLPSLPREQAEADAAGAVRVFLRAYA